MYSDIPDESEWKAKESTIPRHGGWEPNRSLRIRPGNEAPTKGRQHYTDSATIPKNLFLSMT